MVPLYFFMFITYIQTIADFPNLDSTLNQWFSATNNPIPESLDDFGTYISRSISWADFLVDGASINRQQTVEKSGFAYFRFSDPLMTFSGICTTLKLSESTRIFFNLDISYESAPKKNDVSNTFEGF